MTIEIRGSGGDATLETHIRNRLTPLLERWRVTAAGAQVGFVDENGPKGGLDIRCSLTVHLPIRQSVHAEHMGETARLAFDAAFVVLERQLERRVERSRQSRRRPKKYFVAKRLLAAKPGGAASADAGAT